MTDLAVPMDQTPEEEADYGARQQKARRTLTKLILFAIVMFFAGLTSAYVVTRSSVDYWVQITVPSAFYISTGAILLSSAFIQMALRYTRKDEGRRSVPLLVVTMILGLVFTVFQFIGWGELRAMGQFHSFSTVLQSTGNYGKDFTITQRGVVLVEQEGQYFHPDDLAMEKPLNADMKEQANAASQYFRALTYSHLAHLVFGLLALAVLVIRASRGRYTAASHTGLWQGTMYWHFLGGLWVYLLLFLVIIH